MEARRIAAIGWGCIALAFAYVTLALALFDGIAYWRSHVEALLREASGRELLSVSLIPAIWAVAVAVTLWVSVPTRRVLLAICAGTGMLVLWIGSFGYIVLAILLLVPLVSLAFAWRRLAPN